MESKKDVAEHSAAPPCSPSPLGSGDLTGRLVEYWGHQWIISGRNYIGDWDVTRFKLEGDAVIRCDSSISANQLPVEHPHYAKLLPPIE